MIICPASKQMGVGGWFTNSLPARFCIEETSFHFLCLENRPSELAHGWVTRSSSGQAIIEKKSVFCNPWGPKGKWKAFPNGSLRQEMFYLLYSHKKKIDPSNYTTHTRVQVITQEATIWDGDLRFSPKREPFQDPSYFPSQILATRDRLPILPSAWPMGVTRIPGLVPDVLQGNMPLRTSLP